MVIEPGLNYDKNVLRQHYVRRHGMDVADLLLPAEILRRDQQDALCEQLRAEVASLHQSISTRATATEAALTAKRDATQAAYKAYLERHGEQVALEQKSHAELAPLHARMAEAQHQIAVIVRGREADAELHALEVSDRSPPTAHR